MTVTTVRLRVGINRLFPGMKIIQGDKRHFRYHGAFRPETHTPESLLNEIKRGHAFSPELLTGDCGLAHHGRWCSPNPESKSYCPDANKPDHCGRPNGRRISQHFKSAQHLALDIDTGDLAIDDLLADSFICQYCTFIYSTISWAPDNRKWRVVFILGEAITDSRIYRKAATALLDRYETTDQQVKDPARLFFGMKPNNGEAVFLGNLLPMTQVLKLVSEYDERQRALHQEVDRRQLAQVDRTRLTGATPEERYVQTAIEQEIGYLGTRAPGSGERYPSVIPAAMKLESLRLSEWLSPEARAHIDVAAIVLGGCHRNGALQHYGEPHLRKAIDWAISHAEPRQRPADWGRPNLKRNHSPTGAVQRKQPPRSQPRRSGGRRTRASHPKIHVPGGSSAP